MSIEQLITEFRDILILFLGAILGFALARLGNWLDARRQRHVLATTLLAELRWLDHVLRQIAAGGPAAYDPLLHPVIATTLSNVHLLDTSSAEKLASFHSLVLDLQESMRYFAEHHTQLVGHKAKYVAEIKAKAAYACQALPPLVSALVAAGGTKPGVLEGELVPAGELPKLPPPPFGEPKFTPAKGAPGEEG